MDITDQLEQLALFRADSAETSALLDRAVGPSGARLSIRVEDLIADLAVAHARAERMRAAIERYLSLESDCEYVEGAPAICPGIEQRGGPCHWCELRAALED